jgi:hypothetical protein
MKPLSRKSWLFKINCRFGTRDFNVQQAYNGKVSLCTLMSSSFVCLVAIVLGAFLFTIFGILALSVVMSLLSPIILLAGVGFEGIDIFYKMLYVYMAFATCMGILACCNREINFAPDYMKFKSKPNTTKHSIKDSYVVQYVKALKDKVCPIIDITED